jgi:hypothetical protein
MEIVKPFFVYWTSMYDGDKKSYLTPSYKANSKTLKTFEAAEILHAKLNELQKVGGVYGTRIVYHVGALNKESE